MSDATTSPDPDRVAVGYLVPFLIIAFGLAWGILALFVSLPEPMTAVFGELSGHHPLFVLAVYSPAIAAFVLVGARGGVRGVGRFLSRLLLWRCSPAWYAFLIVGIPLLFVGGSALKGNLFQSPLPFASWREAIAALALTAMIGPVEEFGWRGFALPLLQRRLPPFWAGLILGGIWGFWHLPAFWMSGTPQSAWSFMPFLIASVAVSVIVTPLFNAARGSILLPALFHFQLNNPFWPDAQPYDTYVFVAAALVIVWINRKTMFSVSGATEVIPGAERPAEAPTGLRAS